MVDIASSEWSSSSTRTRKDATSTPPLAHGHAPTRLLSLYVFLFSFIPSKLVVAALGGAGTPAEILGLICLVWCIAEWIRVRRSYKFLIRPSSVQLALLFYACSTVASYIAGATRPIDSLELNSADRSLISLAAWSGVILLAENGLDIRERVDCVMRRLVKAVGLVAALGLVQFYTHKLWIDNISIPGLSDNVDLSIVSRDGFGRIFGTATDPIEFGVMMAGALPLAIHYALEDKSRTVLRQWWAVVLIGVACPLSISRSTFVCLAVGMPILVSSWKPARRRIAYATTFLLIGCVYIAIPGMLSTFLHLFARSGSDSSVASRTNSFAIAWSFIQRHPFFGRGPGTFMPSYQILDDQFLNFAIGGGIIGIAGILLIMGIPVRRALLLSKWASEASTRSLARALAAAIASVAASFATFDALAFPIVPSILFLLIGAVGALDRIERRRDVTESAAQTR